MFDIDKLITFALIEIKKFAEEHKDETFYAFSIDADMLCLNSEEKFQKTLASYKENYPKSYDSQKNIDDLKYNTGDWAYQGFATLTNENGFDKKAYDKHYYLSSEKQKTSKYGLAMDKLIEALVSRKAFDYLKKTDNFIANRVEHNY